MPTWRPYDLEHRTVTQFDVPPAAVDDPWADTRRLLDRYPTQQLGRLLGG